jgi:DNA-binding transcriptional MerR regulator
MVYTRSSQKNIINVIEKLESQNIQLQKENNILEKMNAELYKRNTELQQELMERLSVLDKKNSELEKELGPLKDMFYTYSLVEKGPYNKLLIKLCRERIELRNDIRRLLPIAEQQVIPNSKVGANLILDILLKFPQVYHKKNVEFHQNIYQTIVANLCDNYEYVNRMWTTNDLDENKHLTEEDINLIKNGTIFKKFTELRDKYIAKKPIKN